MKTSLRKASLLIAILILSLAALNVLTVHANPVEVSWYVMNEYGPVDGASITIYWSTSPDGPFTIMPADSGTTYVIDRIANVKQNPIFTGYWNPDHPHGMGVADVHPHGGLSGLYFYIEIQSDSEVSYWPTADSYKPGDPSWTPVEASGSPSGYAAAGPGIGNGVTTAYPTWTPQGHVIPEAPLGTVMALGLMMIAFCTYIAKQKIRVQLKQY